MTTLNLTDFMWEVRYHTPDRVRLHLFCRPGLARELAGVLRARGFKVDRLSRGSVVLTAAQGIWAFLRAAEATLTEAQRSALVRYAQAHAVGRKWRRGSADEYRERQAAARAVCEQFGSAYKGVARSDEHE